MQKIQMCDLTTQYQQIKDQIDQSINQVLQMGCFIRGAKVKEFADNLASYLNVKHVIPCANGTDALQIALMSLGLKPNDEIIVPDFTFISSAEVIGLLQLKPVFVDVDKDNFIITKQNILKAITPNTKAIIPVHLFGQSPCMEDILSIAKQYNLYVIEDTAQALGSDYIFSDNTTKKLGTIGTIGCTSFFPSKNLGCYGDGGALFTNDDKLAEKIAMITNHGSVIKYYHKVLGVNSRLDTLQAAILDCKLKHLDTYINKRRLAAKIYDEGLANIEQIQIPQRVEFCKHSFHQYTIKVKDNKRDSLKQYLNDKQIPAMIYYPVPLHKQEAFLDIAIAGTDFDNTDMITSQVLSLPMHTELTLEQQQYIIQSIKEFFNR